MAERHPVDAPRDDLVRSVPFTLDRDTAAGPIDGRTLTGHGAVFNQWTDIASWEGTFRERIAPGAFKKTLRENGSKVKLQFDHGQHPLIGSLPIGTISSLAEDAQGLYVQARLLDNWLIDPVRDAISEGAVDGMSFRFSVEKEQWADGSDGMPERTITEVRLMEVGPVVWPAYDGTDVGVRSAALASEIRSMAGDDRLALARALALTDGPEAPATAPSGPTALSRAAWYSDLRLQLDAELSELYPEVDGAYLWVRDFNDTDVVFELDGYGDQDGTYQLAYTIDADGQVVLADGAPAPVVVQTSYVPEPPERAAGDVGTPSREAAGDAGTSAEGAADPVNAGTPEPRNAHSEAPHPYIPAQRPDLTSEQRKRARDEIAAWLADATTP